jgi:hypothetical protein
MAAGLARCLLPALQARRWWGCSATTSVRMACNGPLAQSTAIRFAHPECAMMVCFVAVLSMDAAQGMRGSFATGFLVMA